MTARVMTRTQVTAWREYVNDGTYEVGNDNRTPMQVRRAAVEMARMAERFAQRGPDWQVFAYEAAARAQAMSAEARRVPT